MRILSGSENRTTRNTAEPKPRRNTVFVFGISEKYLLNFFGSVRFYLSLGTQNTQNILCILLFGYFIYVLVYKYF